MGSDKGDESHLSRKPRFFRGYNEVNEIRKNILVYTMDKEEDGGLRLEAMGHYGDSGSGALININGEVLIAGVKSHGGAAMWGTSHEYTRVGGAALPWIQDNLNSLEEAVSAENC